MVSEARFERFQNLPVDRDEVVLAGAARAENARVDEDLEVVRDGRLRDVEVRSQCTTRKLAGPADGRAFRRL